MNDFYIAEDQRMKEALTRPEVQAVLRDTEIQHLIELLKDNAEEAQRLELAACTEVGKALSDKDFK